MTIQRLLIALLAFVLAFETETHARAGYGIVDLGVIPGGTLSAGSAINASGVVVGSGQTAQGNTHAIKWGENGPLDLMTLPGGRFSNAQGINASGTIVGTSEMRVGQSSWQTRAFKMESGGSMIDLGVPRDSRASFATAINDGGQISGYAIMNSGIQRAFISGGPGNFTMLETFRPDGNSIAYGINSGGQVVGAAEIAPGLMRAFVTTAVGPLVDLGVLGGPGALSVATGINDIGRIVGYSGEVGAYRAFRTALDGRLEDLGSIHGANSMLALSINARGDVVGSADTGGGSGRAFLYTDVDGLIDLNRLIEPGSGWVLTSATGINDQGQISGTGIFQGETRAFRLDPNSFVVPEPSAAVLVGIGLGGWLLARRRTLRP